MKLYTELEPTDICAQDMEDGQVGVITQWSGDKAQRGKIVQRYKNILICLGKSSDLAWVHILGCGEKYTDCRVRILPKGTLFEI